VAGVSIDQATMNVVSHGLINSLAAIAGTARAVRPHLEDAPPAEAAVALELLGRIQELAEKGAELLGDVMQGLPPEGIASVEQETGTVIDLP
jgi:hypothetical protein